MPLVVMSFTENDKIRKTLSDQGEKIASIVATALGYKITDVAVRPDVLEPRNQALTYNLPKLEFNIVGGIRFAGEEQKKAEEIWAQLAIQIPELDKIPFAVWLQSTRGAYVDSEN